MTAVPRPRGQGRIITVFAAKGGCGKTTLATNLAVVLNAGGNRRVCLVDLDLTFGDVASSLRLEPVRSLADAVPRAGRLDLVATRALTTPFGPGLDCILAPERPGENEKVSPAVVGELLTELPRWYDYVVIDTPAQFSPRVLTALDASDHHVLLTTPERPALKNLRLTIDMLDLLCYCRDSRSIVFNRCDSSVGLSATEVERVVKSPIAGHIPSSRDVPTSTNLGEPLASAQPNHPVSLAVAEFTATHLIERRTRGPASA